MALYSQFFHAKAIEDLFSDRYLLAQMLQAEAALAKAQAENGLFASQSADSIAKCCEVGLMDVEKIKNELPLGGNAVIPLVKQLTTRVAERDVEAAKYVHLGATSQDIVDTATVLQIRDYLHWLTDKLADLENILVALTQKYRQTPMAGRTLLQHATPIVFGSKTAAWLESITRSKDRIKAGEQRLLVVQLAGAAGGGNAFMPSAVQRTFAQLLELGTAHAWHTQRDNLVAFSADLGILTGSLGKIATDVSLLMQTEVGEVFEGAAVGKGASSTMPHKRNPVTCTAILANAHRTPFLVASMMAALPQEHERSAGLWHSEWPVLTEIMQLTGGAVARTIELLEGLEVDTNRMLQNLELTRGLIYAEQVSLALAAQMGKAAAHALVEKMVHAVNVGEVLNLADVTSDVLSPADALARADETINDILKRYAHKL